MILFDDTEWELIDERPESELTSEATATTGRPFPPCPTCRGPGIKLSRKHRAYQRELRKAFKRLIHCPTCDGVGFVGVPVSDEALAEHEPGSSERVAIMGQRYRAGLSLWIDATP